MKSHGKVSRILELVPTCYKIYKNINVINTTFKRRFVVLSVSDHTNILDHTNHQRY